MHLPVPALNPDTLIALLLVAAGLYGAIAGKARLRLFILSIYIGIVLAEQLARVAAPYLKVLDPTQVTLALFAVPIVLFGVLGGHHGKHADKGSIIANILVGLVAGALIVSSGLHLLPVSQLTAIDHDSFIAMQLQQYHLWLAALLPVIVIMLGLIGRRHEGGKRGK